MHSLVVNPLNRRWLTVVKSRFITTTSIVFTAVYC